MRNEELIVAHVKYAFGILNRRYRYMGNGDYCATHAELDDAGSEAMHALFTAGRRFDPGRGVPFRVFVQLRIVGALDDWFTSRKLRYGLTGAGRPCREQAATDWKSQRPEAWIRPFSDVTEDAGGSVGLGGRNEMTLLTEALKAIPGREANVLRRRFWREDSCEDIAADMGLSFGRVSQLTKRGLGLLRKELALRGVRKVADLV